MNCLLAAWRAVALAFTPRLKFLKRANVLWFEVSDRALSAGDGGDKSGKGKSCIGAFQ